jgi:hypothetical protein
MVQPLLVAFRCRFLFAEFIRASLIFPHFSMMLVTVSFIILILDPIFKSRSVHRIVRPLRNNMGWTLVHLAT